MGTTTSFNNTPQAGNDAFTYSEDYSLNNDVLILNVMANDLGGAAKTLFSVDDGTSSGSSAQVDLLSKDTVYTSNTAGLAARRGPIVETVVEFVVPVFQLLWRRRFCVAFARPEPADCATVWVGLSKDWIRGLP